MESISDVMSESSQRYFMREIQQAGYGVQGLVLGAYLHAQGTKRISSNAESHFHMLLLSLLKDLTGVQQSILMELFKHIKANPSLCTNTRLPTCQMDANRIYMSGSQSMYKNIPHAKVFLHKGHACVKLQDVIEHMVA